MDFFRLIDLIFLFIVIYLLVLVGRWFIFPHLKVFPNIPPQGLWKNVVGLAMYVATAIFHYIVIALVIIYIIWIIIKKFVPNFPIPFKLILLRMPPFYPLEKAGVLPLIDRMRQIIFSTWPLPKRLIESGKAFGQFAAKSTSFVFSTLGIPAPQTRYTSAPQKQAPEKESPFTDAETREIQESYLQCIEESTFQITPEMTESEKKKIGLKNQGNAAMCKLQMMSTYSRIMADKVKK